MKLFDKLNTPAVVVLVLGFVVAVNVLLLMYRYANTPESSDPVPLAVQEEGTPTSASTTEETTDSPEPPEEPEPRAAPESERPEGEPSEPEQAPEPPEREPRDEPESREPEPREQERAEAPPTNVGPSTLANALAGCGTAEEECVAAYVAGTDPAAEYVEEVPDANARLSQGNRLFYFRDPTLAACQYSWENYTFGDGVTYTIIVYGAGSFDNSGQGCIPAF